MNSQKFYKILITKRVSVRISDMSKQINNKNWSHHTSHVGAENFCGDTGEDCGCRWRTTAHIIFCWTSDVLLRRRINDVLLCTISKPPTWFEKKKYIIHSMRVIDSPNNSSRRLPERWWDSLLTKVRDHQISWFSWTSMSILSCV